MTLTYAADGKHLYDGNNDIMVELSPGVVECARKFQFPEGARKGDYQLAINLCEGQPGKTPLVDRYVMTTMVTL